MSINKVEDRGEELVTVQAEDNLLDNIEVLDRMLVDALGHDRFDESESWAPARATAAKFDALAVNGQVNALVLDASTDNHVVTVMFGQGTNINAFNMTEDILAVDEMVQLTRKGPSYFVERKK